MTMEVACEGNTRRSWSRSFHIQRLCVTFVYTGLLVLLDFSPFCEAWLTTTCRSDPSALSTVLPRSRSSRKRRRDSFHLSMISKQQLGSFEALDESQLDVANHVDRRVLMIDFTNTDARISKMGSSLPSVEPLNAHVNDGEAPLIDFETAWDCQKEIMERHFDRLQVQQRLQQQLQDDSDTDLVATATSFIGTSVDGDSDHLVTYGKDTVIMLEHNPVYTLGTGSDERFVLSTGISDDNSDSNYNTSQDDEDNDNKTVECSVPVVRMDRGGEVTYHGPGQLTVYPILDLRSYNQDIHWYMRALEEATILALSNCGIDPNTIERQDDVTGVWVQNHKVAAVGIKVRKWITMHGVAINVEDRALDNFEGIVPCGLEGRKVGCINQFLRANDIPELSVHEFSKIMAAALEEVFRIRLVDPNTSNQ